MNKQTRSLFPRAYTQIQTGNQYCDKEVNYLTQSVVLVVNLRGKETYREKEVRGGDGGGPRWRRLEAVGEKHLKQEHGGGLKSVSWGEAPGSRAPCGRLLQSSGFYSQ